MGVPAVLKNRDFDLYWTGVVFSQIGTRGTVAANLYHVYQLTGSVTQTGLVGAAQAVALLVLSPLGGVLADRWDRRRLLQASQAVAMVVAAALAALTLTGAHRGLAGGRVGGVDHRRRDIRPTGASGADSSPGPADAAASGVRACSTPLGRSRS